jgi:hypothetical protein
MLFFLMMFLMLLTHTEKVRNTIRGCRLWNVKNSGCKNSSPTEVKRTFIHQNLSILITKSLWIFCQTKSSPQNQRTYISVGTFSFKIYVHFIFTLLQSFYISGIRNFICQKSGLIWQDKRSCFFPFFSVCAIWKEVFSTMRKCGPTWRPDIKFQNEIAIEIWNRLPRRWILPLLCCIGWYIGIR